MTNFSDTLLMLVMGKNLLGVITNYDYVLINIIVDEL